ncbi:MAG: GxxExxY protein [Bacteroidetes bacterium]|nr:GxxExxY protein [Bacteroidota bacterium]
MNAHNYISGQIIDIGFKIHQKLGPGLFESVYEQILCFELKKRGIKFQRQVALPVVWEEIKLEHGFRVDLIIENLVLVEIKSIENVAPVHLKQTLTYLKLSELKLGLLMNFQVNLLKDGIHRIVNQL